MRRILSAGVIVFTAACIEPDAGGSGAPAPTDVTTRFDSGIDSLSLLPVQMLWTAGGSGETTEFHHVRSIAASADGVFVLDATGTAITAIDSLGKVTRRFGRRGRGPGEIVAAWDLDVRHDTLFVLDESLQLFSTEGEYITRSQPPNLRAAFDGTMTPAGFGLVRRRYGSAGASEAWDSLFVGFLDVSTERQDHLPIRLGQRLHKLDGISIMIPLVGTSMLRIVVAPSGDVYVRDADRFSIRVYSSSGVLREHLFAEVPRRPLSSADVRDIAENDWQVRGREEAIRSVIMAAPRADHIAAIDRLLVSAEGRLLIERLDRSERPFAYRDASRTTTWLLIDRDRTAVGHVALNRRFAPMVFHGCRITGVQPDSLDTPIVVQYHIPDC